MAAPAIAAAVSNLAAAAKHAAAKAAKDWAKSKAKNEAKKRKKFISTSVFGCLGCLMSPILALMLVVGGLLALFAGQQDVAAHVDSMPDFSMALADPQYWPVIHSAEVAEGVSIDTKKLGDTAPERRVKMLLAMAWVDSRWGTQKAANPIATGSKLAVAAQAAIAAGMAANDPNLVMALAIAGAESGGWNPSAQSPTNGDGTTDYGLWQINSIHGVSPPAIFDPVTNAKWMMQLSSQGTNWRQWTTAWSDGDFGYKGGTYLGAGSAYLVAPTGGTQTYMDQAKQAVLNGATGAHLDGDYTGIVMMMKSIWNQAKPAVDDPNSRQQLDGIFKFSDSQLITFGNDPLAAVTRFYTMGNTKINNSVQPHVQMVINTYKMGFGNGDVRQKIVDVAMKEVGTVACQSGGAKYNTPDRYWCPNASGEWCAYFSSWTWRQAGVDFPVTGAAPDYATLPQANFKPGGQVAPLPGDVVLWSSPDHPAGAHVSVVVDVRGPDSIETVDGNFVVNGVSQTYLRHWFNPNDSKALNGWKVLGYASPIKGG